MKAYLALEERFNQLAHLQHLRAITGWDEAVMMPPGGGEARAAALATLSALQHEIITNKEISDLILGAKHESLENAWQQANLMWMEKEHHNASLLPANLVEEKTRAGIRSEQAWRTLRAENNWQGFKPLLAESITLQKQSATMRAEADNKTSYDVVLDDYSPGMTQAIIDPIFEKLKAFLPEFIQEVCAKQKSTNIVKPTGSFSIESQEKLGRLLMKTIGFDFNHGRLDVSHHPFCGGVPQDIRITTSYKQDDITASIMAICHETGHAMYERGLPEAWINQPVGKALGMSVHESQSLLVEMQACRSLEFIEFLTQHIVDIFGAQEAFTPNNLFALYTKVEPGLIRIYADEVTYPLHVILRYDIEKKLFNDEITVDDLPEIWNDSMQQFFGLSTKNNFKDGVMQDVHWPSGVFGYFPAYTLGALIAAQCFHSAKQKYPDISKQLAKGDFSNLMQWLCENIHSKGSSLDFNTLMVEATGETLNPDYYFTHLKERYL